MVATASALARTAALAAAVLALVASPSAAMPVDDIMGQIIDDAGHTQLPAALKTCLGKTGATLTYPGDKRYANLSAAENTNFHRSPNVLASPSSTAQVAAVIKCVAAQTGKTKVSPRSGGHGYAAYSLDANVVLDSSKMTDLAFDTQAKTIKVAFGQTLGPLASSMADKGFALPHGTCPQVGVGGHSTGGGWGFTSRKWGWLVDRIVALEVVDATGTVRNLSPSSTGADGDLWWAMRGAGANNFGVVTHFTYAMETAPTDIVNFSHTYNSNDDCAQVLLAVQKLGGSQGGFPAEMGGEVLLYGENSGDDGACTWGGQYLGSKSDYQTQIKKLNSALSQVNVKATKTSAKAFTSWKAALTDLMGDLHAPKVYEPYYAQSIVDDGTPNYTLDSANNIIKAVQNAVGVDGSGNSISFDLNGYGSATNIKPAPHGDMSFIHRNALFFSQIYSYAFPNGSDPNAQKDAYQKISAITESVRQAKPSGDWRSYQNYIDANLTDFGSQYYGNSLQRLKTIKHTADPQTIFDFDQGLAHA